MTLSPQWFRLGSRAPTVLCPQLPSVRHALFQISYHKLAQELNKAFKQQWHVGAKSFINHLESFSSQPMCSSCFHLHVPNLTLDRCDKFSNRKKQSNSPSVFLQHHCPLPPPASSFFTINTKQAFHVYWQKISMSVFIHLRSIKALENICAKPRHILISTRLSIPRMVPSFFVK